jgi:precorrin-6x reductase
MTAERDGQAASWIAVNDRTAAETAALQADAAQALTRGQAGMAWAAGAAQGEIAAASAADAEMLNSLSALLQTDGKLVLAGAAAAKSVNQAMLEDLRCKLTQARADVTASRRAGEVGATILQTKGGRLLCR